MVSGETATLPKPTLLKDQNFLDDAKQREWTNSNQN